MLLPIITAPDPFLKQASAPVDAVTPDIRALISNMFETMYAAHGIGLAAVQVGILKRVIVIDLDDGNPAHTLALVNAEVIEESEEGSWYNEGCLSFPSQYGEVERPARVAVRYLDENGEQKVLHAEGLLATCVQHEIDHTNGVTFVDHLSSLKRDMILRKLKKAKKQGHDHHHHHAGCNHDHDHDHDHGHVHGEHCNH